jgi:CubicO group peptidase (beta-lactamase class C family)
MKYYNDPLPFRTGNWINRIFIMLCIGMVFSSQVPGQTSQTFQARGKTIYISRFDADVRKMISEAGIPAVSLAVISNNQVVYYKNYGYKNVAEKARVDQQTIFESASLSKSFFVFLVLQLVDEGKLDLDKPLYQYLENPLLAHDPRYKKITARMVLSHSSGIENWQSDNNPDTLEILSNPGEKFIYSGEGYNYLAKVVEVILGQKEKEYFQQLVFSPLGLKRTYACFSADGSFPVNYASGYTRSGKPVPKWKNAEVVPSSGVNTTAGDYAAVLVSTFDKRYVSGKRMVDILRPACKLVDTSDMFTWGAGFGLQYGQGDTLLFQNGDNQGYKALMYYSVVNKCGLVFLTNSDLGIAIAKRLNDMTVSLNIAPTVDLLADIQYPGDVLRLLKIYKDKGTVPLFGEIASLETEKTDTEVSNTLSQLADIISERDTTVSKRLLQENTRIQANKLKVMSKD